MLKVELNPVVSFKANENENLIEKKVNSKSLLKEQGPDEFITPKKKNDGSFKNGIGNIWKFFSVLGTMTNSTIKGLVYGTFASAGILITSTIINAPKAIKSGLKLTEVFAHPVKNAGTAGKIIAFATGAVVLASNLVAGKLQANQNTAVIDHKLKIGHRDV
ncbi:hypothetical protein J6G99_03750 [bacterium]|nr:hypothetical protein [bacterium]